jgi:hypothetical protein
MMYMRFRVQFLDRRSGHWVDVAHNADSGYRQVGSADFGPLQDGRSFAFVPVKGAAPFTMRGLVDFQWRRGATVVHSAQRRTTAPHRSLAGADPPGYTAATCKLG